MHVEFEPELFPLPYFQTHITRKPFVNRSCAKSFRVNRAQVDVANGIISGLNWCANTQSNFSGSAGSEGASRAQRRALKHIWQSARVARPPCDAATPQGAARELLKLDLSYSGVSGAHLARYGEGPGKNHGSPLKGVSGRFKYKKVL